MAPEPRAPLEIRADPTATKIKIISGIATLSVAVILLALARHRLSHLFEAGAGETGLLWMVGIGGFAWLACVVLAATDFLGGLRDLLRPTFYADGPEPFEHYQREVLESLCNGRMTFFGSLSSRLRLLFGQNITELAPSEWRVVDRNGRALLPRRVIEITLLLAAVYLVVFESASDPRILSPLGILIVAAIAQAAVEYGTSLSLVPTAPRVARSSQGSEYYEGFGHPTHLYSRIPILFPDLHLGEFPNRVYRWKDDHSVAAVSDVGEFTGFLLIERQPEVIPTRNTTIGAILMLASAAFQLAAVVSLALFTASVTLQAAMDDLYVVAMTGAALLLVWKSRGLRRQAEELIESVQFSSVVLFLRFDGEVSRADIRVGRAETDSVSSANTAARSNFTAQFWAAEMISEARDVDQRRWVIEARQTPVSDEWVETARRGIWQFRSERVRPVGIDFSSPESQEILGINQQIHARKAEASFPPPPSEVSAPRSNRELASSAENLLAETTGDSKECPDCAETVKRRARKCRFCGYRFEERFDEAASP